MNDQELTNERLLSEDEKQIRKKEARKERRIAIILGTVSPLIVIMAQLINVEPMSLLEYAKIQLLIGYAIKTLLAMVIGAFVLIANKNVKDRWVAIQIGIMAPAIILSLLNGNHLKESKKDYLKVKEQLEALQAKDKENKGANSTIYNNNLNESNILDNYSLLTVRKAYAQTDTELPKGWHKNPPSFIYGLTGNAKNTWFVVVGSHRTELGAEKQKNELKNIGYDAKVFPPFGGSKYYGVMIGSFLNYNEALALKKKAIKDGLPNNTYLWKY